MTTEPHWIRLSVALGSLFYSWQFRERGRRPAEIVVRGPRLREKIWRLGQSLSKTGTCIEAVLLAAISMKKLAQVK